MLQYLHLGFTPGEYVEVCRTVDSDGTDSISLQQFMRVFEVPEVLPAPQMAASTDKPGDFWTCLHCTCRNPKVCRRAGDAVRSGCCRSDTTVADVVRNPLDIIER